MTQLSKRREFLAASLAATAGVALSAVAADAPVASNAAGREFYELRRYQFRRGPMTKRADEYFKNALVPALGRAGCGPVGVFNVTIGIEAPATYVLIPHAAAEALVNLHATLGADPEYHKAGEAFIKVPATDPAYIKVDTEILQAFASVPKIEVPKKEPRIFELRTYYSHSYSAHLKKVEMFNNGEVAIFRRLGLTPVFFGGGLVGANQPHLTYMLVFPDMAARDKAFAAFRGDAEWDKLRNTPGYSDPEIVTNISNQFLAPAACSQI